MDPRNNSFLLVVPLRDGGTPVARLEPSGRIVSVTDDLNDYAGLTVSNGAIATARQDVRTTIWVGDDSTPMRRVGDPAIGGEGWVAWAGNERVLVNARMPSGYGIWAVTLDGDMHLLAKNARIPESSRATDTPSTSAEWSRTSPASGQPTGMAGMLRRARRVRL